ncbi:MAG: hypothetical protein AAF234_15930 [Pseudomonadota bacterium]
MSDTSNYLENKMLDHVLGTTPFPAPSAVYAALFTSPPNDAGGGTEVSGNGYVRQQATFNGASDGVASNNALVEFIPSGGDWGTVTHAALFDALTGGNYLYGRALTAAKVTADGDPVQFPSGSLTVSQD